MKNLAILGHPTRGIEVIEILQMLGGKCEEVYNGNDVNWVYTIENGVIEWDYPCDKYTIFSLEEFIEQYPYKIGDTINIMKPNKKGIGHIVNMHWSKIDECMRYNVKQVGEEPFFCYKEDLESNNKDEVITYVLYNQNLKFIISIPKEKDCYKVDDIITFDDNNYKISFKFEQLYIGNNQYLIPCVVKKLNKVYKWSCVCDNSLNNIESKKLFLTKTECYDDIRNLVIDKLKHNCECEVKFSTDSITYKTDCESYNYIINEILTDE